MSPAISQPSARDIETWWKWAASFSDANGPFRIQIGKDFDQVPQPQPLLVFCLSCTAGNGGVDPVPRPLGAALRSGVPVLVPAFVGCNDLDSKSSASLIDQARIAVGTIDSDGKQSAPEVFFKVDGTPLTPFYVEQNVNSVTFVPGNSFHMPPGTHDVGTAGYWALITPPPAFKNIEFGGRGGHISEEDTKSFETGVTFAV